MRTMFSENDIPCGCSDGDKWRQPRMQRVIGYVCALADNYGNQDILGKVSNLHDHEGTLTVRWKVKPTTEEMEFFAKAWESVIGDGCDNVKHESA